MNFRLSHFVRHSLIRLGVNCQISTLFEEMDWQVAAFYALLMIDNSYYSLELNIRQLVLADIASNIGESRLDQENSDVLSTIDLVRSKVETRAVPENSDPQDTEENRVYMVRRIYIS